MVGGVEAGWVGLGWCGVWWGCGGVGRHLTPIFWFCDCNDLLDFVPVVALVLEPTGRV